MCPRGNSINVGPISCRPAVQVFLVCEGLRQVPAITQGTLLAQPQERVGEGTGSLDFRVMTWKDNPYFRSLGFREEETLDERTERPCQEGAKMAMRECVREMWVKDE